MLNKLKELVKGKRIKIVGHKNPDFDSIASGIILERFLLLNGIDANFICGSVSDTHALSALEYLGIDIFSHRGKIEETDLLFLVDHHSTEYKNFVAGCIDHHPTKIEINFPIYLNLSSSSCALSVFRLAEKEGTLFDKNDIKLVLLSVYMDTRSCKSTKFIKTDSEWISEITEKYSFANELDTFERLGYCLTDMSASLDELSRSDIKEYVFNSKKVYISHIQTFLTESTEKILSNVCFYVEEKRKRLGVEIWILMISDPKCEVTSVIRFDEGGIYRANYDRLLSRSIDIIPAIEKEFM